MTSASYTRIALAVLIGSGWAAVADNTPAWAQAQVAQGSGITEAPIGKVISLTGSLTIEHNSAIVQLVGLPAGAKSARVGDLVYRKDVIQTGADSKVGITFTDGTAFSVSSNARMELNEFIYRPGGKTNASLFNLVRGTFTFIAGSVAKTGDMKVETPVATMGIRGTTPRVEISDDGSVRFSTLVEEIRPGDGARGTATRRALRGRGATKLPADPKVDEAFRNLMKLEYKLCRGC